VNRDRVGMHDALRASDPAVAPGSMDGAALGGLPVGCPPSGAVEKAMKASPARALELPEQPGGGVVSGRCRLRAGGEREGQHAADTRHCQKNYNAPDHGSHPFPTGCEGPRVTDGQLRQPGWLREPRGFASPPLDGFAFVDLSWCACTLPPVRTSG
jgi:hypothetical protein